MEFLYTDWISERALIRTLLFQIFQAPSLSAESRVKIIRKIIQEIPAQDWDEITSVNNQSETGHLAIAIFQHFLHLETRFEGTAYAEAYALPSFYTDILSSYESKFYHEVEVMTCSIFHLI